MLIRFAVENYRSFKKRQVFSMAAGKHTRHRDHLVTIKGKRLLKGSVLFGANAAGKSNLIKAVNFGKNIVFSGVSAGKTFNKFFRIDGSYFEKPGIFQYDFVRNDNFYSYGVAISYKDNKILSEWLYLWVDNKEKKLFERDENGEITTDVKFTQDENEQRFNIYAKDVPDDKTFLFKITENKLKDTKDFEGFYDAIEWFRSLIIIFPQTKYNYRQYIMNDSLESLGRLMSYFDTGIEEILKEEKDIDKVLTFLPEEVKDHIINDIQESFSKGDVDKVASIDVTIGGRWISFSKVNESIVAHQLVMNHGNEKNLFELSDESDGTKRLFDLVPLYKKGEQNFVILVDELDRSFHSKLTLEFIRKFYEKTLGKNTQLIVTLHDLNVLNLNLLRQDEIWFVERKEDCSSELYSLNKFKERFDHSVGKDYLLGRYGAVPNFGIDPWEDGEE